MKAMLPIFTALALPAFCASGMDRFDALSQIESQNNDHAIGRQREVSRYQILPAFWEHAMAVNKTIPVFRPTDPVAAKAVVDWIMQGRCQAFESRYHRQPTDFEYYILWHRPACFVGRPTPRQITSAEVERGRRFANLCRNDD
jgi:hypothetical protein